MVPLLCQVLVGSECSICTHGALCLSRHSVIALGLSPAAFPRHVDTQGKLALSWESCYQYWPANYYRHHGQTGFGCSANPPAGHWQPGECIAVCRACLAQATAHPVLDLISCDSWCILEMEAYKCVLTAALVLVQSQGCAQHF